MIVFIRIPDFFVITFYCYLENIVFILSLRSLVIRIKNDFSSVKIILDIWLSKYVFV